MDDVQRSGDTVTLHLQIQAPTPDTTVTVYYGPTDQLTFAERWPHHIQLGGPTAGKLTVPIPAGSGPGAGRVLVQGKFGSVWSDTSAGWQ